MRICYLCADRGVAVFENDGSSVHVRATVFALKRLKEDIYVICTNAKGKNRFDEEVTVFEIKDFVPLMILYRIADVIWYKLTKPFLSLLSSSDHWRQHFDQPPFFLGITNEILYLFNNLKIYSHGNRILKKQEVDLIYERFCGWNVSGIWLAKKFKIPLILEVNALVSYEQSMYGKVYLLRLLKLLEKRAFKKAKMIVVVSKNLKEQVASKEIDLKKIFVLPNGVDPEVFHPLIKGDEIKRQYGLNGKTIIGFTGNFRKWHGLGIALRGAKVMARKYLDICFFVIGDGPERNSLEAFVKRNDLGNQVIFTGIIPHNCIPYYLAAMDITIAPNLAPYMSPTKIIEYMAMGRPVIAPKLASVEELITHGKEGVLFEPNNEEQFIDALSLLINDKTLRRQLGKAARKKVEENFTWKKNAEFVINVAKGLKENEGQTRKNYIP